MISLIYTPLSSLWSAQRKQHGRIVHHSLVWFVMKLVVAQLCWAKDHESIRYRVRAVRKCDVVFTPPPASYDPATVQPI